MDAVDMESGGPGRGTFGWVGVADCDLGGPASGSIGPLVTGVEGPAEECCGSGLEWPGAPCGVGTT